MELREPHPTHLLCGQSRLNHGIILVYELCVLCCWGETWGMRAGVKEGEERGHLPLPLHSPHGWQLGPLGLRQAWRNGP